jgi:hypothetical protein
MEKLFTDIQRVQSGLEAITNFVGSEAVVDILTTASNGVSYSITSVTPAHMNSLLMMDAASVVKNWESILVLLHTLHIVLVIQDSTGAPKLCMSAIDLDQSSDFAKLRSTLNLGTQSLEKTVLNSLRNIERKLDALARG